MWHLTLFPENRYLQAFTQPYQPLNKPKPCFVCLLFFFFQGRAWWLANFWVCFCAHLSKKGKQTAPGLSYLGVSPLPLYLRLFHFPTTSGFILEETHRGGDQEILHVLNIAQGWSPPRVLAVAPAAPPPEAAASPAHCSKTFGAF